MSRLRQLILTFVLLWVIAKMGFFFTGNAGEGHFFTVMLNLLFILLVEFFALRFKYKKVTLIESNFLDDIKTSVRAAGLYIVVITLFGLVYYSFIHPEYYGDITQERIDLAIQQTSDPEAFAEMKRRDETMPDATTAEQYVQNVTENSNRLYSWWFISGMTLLLLLLVSIFNSVFVTLLYRKVLLK